MFARFILAAACAASTYFIFDSYYGSPISMLGFIFGLCIALFVVKIEQALRKVPLRNIFGGVVGMMIGLLTAFMLAYGLSFVSNIMEKQHVVPWVYALLTGVMGYLGLALGAKKIEEFNLLVGWGHATAAPDTRILDTSVIIDGRIADVCEAGFIQGTLIVPRFVLEELQYIADSSDPLKRVRGRRGLDVLNRMQKNAAISIEITEQDFPKIKTVDAKLIALARTISGKLVTNDFNLNKVAELQGVGILNLNQLANAMKPVVLPGEVMTVKVIKEGKEPGQGVAYLDDGTMIIIENAHKYQNSTVVVTVTSVLQTTAGRMIFSEIKEGLAEREAVFGNDKR